MTNQDAHNDEELKGLTPILHSISKDGEFEVPQKFFAQLNDDIISEAAELREIELFAPQFTALSKDDLLLTPERFFEAFESDLKHQADPTESDLEVPENFFEKQESVLMTKTGQGEGELVFPKEFFEKQNEAIMVQVGNEDEQEGRVVSFKKYRRAIISMAAAAAVAAAVWFTFPVEEEQCVTFACLLEQSDLSSEDLLFVDDYDLNEFIASESDLDQASEDDIEMIDFLIESEYDFDELYYEIQ